MIKTNDLKKGTRIKLANGWYGTLTDNKKGNIREAEVEGIYTEIGSVYAHDIIAARVGSEWMTVEHTPAQVKARKLNAGVFGDLGVVHYNDQSAEGL
jgi:hypothetical protein